MRDKSGWAVGVVVVASLVVTLLFWMILPASFRVIESDDYIGVYEPVARNIVNGKGITQSDGSLSIRYPPGYALLLAGTFWLSDVLSIPEEITLSAFVLLGMALSSVFVFFLSRSVWGPWPGSISALIWMTYPFALWLTKQPNSEIPFLVVFYGGFAVFWYALLHKKRPWRFYILSGLLMGVATLIRPILVGAGLVAGCILWLAGRDMTVRVRMTVITMLLLGNVAAIISWEAYIYAKTGEVILLSTNGVASMYGGLYFVMIREDYGQTAIVSQDVMALMQDARAHGLMNSVGEVAAFMTQQLQRRPLAVAKLIALKSARSWYGTYTGRYEMTVLLIQIAYLTLILWGSVAAWKEGGTARQLVISVWLMVAYFWGMMILVVPMLRLMVPAIGLLFVLVPAAFVKRPSVAASCSHKTPCP